MTLTRILCVLGLLCAVVHARLTNYTIDDTSPAVTYTQDPLIRCTLGSCDPSWTDRLHNGTSSTTSSPIMVSFTGTAVYVFLETYGRCIFNIDGVQAGVYTNIAESDTNISLAYHNTALRPGPHTLVMYPAKAGSFIQFDYVVYTNNMPKSHLGAIVGGVVGGLALAAVLTVAAFFLCRREKQKRLSTRGIRLGDHWPDKPSLKLAEMGAQK
ncbi:hypothetical protein C8R43DRAFT_1051920 [Mycena crocata]|nr:hypothetical protein C8R43DRAFT_1051920 [Mycena crocata]